MDVSAYYAAEDLPETKDYLMQQVMVRVKDPVKSLDFYTKVLGFHLVMHRDFPQWGFSVYFVAYCKKADIPEGEEAQWKFCMNCPACVELTWNHGSEKEEGGRCYNTGNSDATGTKDGEKVKGGFGHLGITVPDVYAACERFKALGAEFHKSPNSGGMKGLAFVKDPDGYLIEVLPRGPMVTQPVDCNGIAVDGGEGYKDNSK
jgi:lactoylglutathione lyase